MQKSTIPWDVKQLKKMIEVGKIDFNHPIQRRGGQWDHLSKSLLIHSCLANYPVPALYFLKELAGQDDNNKDIYVYSVLDGKQRLINIVGFINGDYALHDDTPPVYDQANDIMYELAGKCFTDLTDDIREDIKRFKFTIYNLEDATDDEIEECFYRLNNGVLLTKDQKTKSKIGLENARFLDLILKYPFFINNAYFTPIQIRSSEDLSSLLQSLMLLFEYKYKSFAKSDVFDFAISIKNALSEERKDLIANVFAYLSEAFAGSCSNKWLKKINVPMVALMAKRAIENNIDSNRFKIWFDQFFNNYKVGAGYGLFVGSGSIKKYKVNGRINIMSDDFNQYFSIIDTQQTMDGGDISA